MGVQREEWWRLRGSNSLPQRCQRCALPGELSPQYLIVATGQKLTMSTATVN